MALFALAFWGDKYLRDNQQHPILYSLGLGVHCTSWAFFGTTSQAAEYGWAIIPTYLGIVLTMAFAFPVLLNISRLCQQHNISSLADLIAMKYLDTLKEMTTGEDNKVVYIPYEATGVLSSVGGIKDLLVSKGS